MRSGGGRTRESEEYAKTQADERMRAGRSVSQEEEYDESTDADDDDSAVTASTKGAACSSSAKLLQARW